MQYFDTVGRATGKPAAVIYRDYFNHAYAGNDQSNENGIS